MRISIYLHQFFSFHICRLIPGQPWICYTVMIKLWEMPASSSVVRSVKPSSVVRSPLAFVVEVSSGDGGVRVEDDDGPSLCLSKSQAKKLCNFEEILRFPHADKTNRTANSKDNLVAYLPITVSFCFCRFRVKSSENRENLESSEWCPCSSDVMMCEQSVENSLVDEGVPN